MSQYSGNHCLPHVVEERLELFGDVVQVGSLWADWFAERRPNWLRIPVGPLLRRLLARMAFVSGICLNVQVCQVDQVSPVPESVLSYGPSRNLKSVQHLSRSVVLVLILRLVGLGPVVQMTLGEVERHVGWRLDSGSWLLEMVI